MGCHCFSRLAYFMIKNVSHLLTARDLFSSLLGPNLDSLSSMSPSICIFWPGFSWPAIVRASCLSGYTSKMVLVRLSAVFVVSSANRSSTQRGLLSCGCGGGDCRG
jgi:hypothetical protein